jgi:shikimate kinase
MTLWLVGMMGSGKSAPDDSRRPGRSLARMAGTGHDDAANCEIDTLGLSVEEVALRIEGLWSS